MKDRYIITDIMIFPKIEELEEAFSLLTKDMSKDYLVDTVENNRYWFVCQKERAQRAFARLK